MTRQRDDHSDDVVLRKGNAYRRNPHLLGNGPMSAVDCVAGDPLRDGLLTHASYLRRAKVGLVDYEPDLVPELTVSDLAASRRFWCELIGFAVAYARLNEGFAYLTLGNAHLMLDQVDIGRTWATADLQPPFGRGVNLQLGVPSLDEVLRRLGAADWPLFSAAEERWYSRGTDDIGVRQCLVQDPDGYLVRPQQSLGTRPATG